MQVSYIVTALDEEIARLQLVRELLIGEGKQANSGVAGAAGKAKKVSGRGKRVLSAEARERIASAQRKRWAAVKRAGKKAAKH